MSVQDQIDRIAGAKATLGTYLAQNGVPVPTGATLDEMALHLADVVEKQNKITAAGILKGDGAGGVTAATPGTDYLAEAPVTSVNGATGAAKTSWYFDVTGSVASPTTTQTVAQIVAAQTAGFAPICKATFSDFQGLPATLPALLISDMICVFGGIGSTGGDTFYLTVMIDGAGTLTAKTDSVVVKEADIEKALGYKPIGAADVPVKKVNGAIGDVKSTFYVTITSAEDESISADKTLKEIYTAYEKGYAVYAKTATSPQIIVPLTIAVHSGNDYAVVFNGAVTFGDTTEYAISNDGSGWTIYAKDIAFKDNIPTIPTALKNPHPLNIKIGNATTIYDGSAEQTVEIPDGGGTNESLGISGASVGQAALVKSVDETGKPTEWEPAALAKADGSNIPSSADIKAKWRSTLQTLPGIILYGKDSDGKILVYTDAACTQAATYLVGMDIADLKNALFVYNHNTYQCVGLQEAAGMPGTYAIPVFARTEVLKTEVIVESIVCDVLGFLGGSVSAPAILSKQIYTRQTLPNVTTADNGKILRVVNGAWAAVEIANANGGRF